MFFLHYDWRFSTLDAASKSALLYMFFIQQLGRNGYAARKPLSVAILSLPPSPGLPGLRYAMKLDDAPSVLFVVTARFNLFSVPLFY